MPGLVAPLVVWPQATGGETDPARLLAALVALGDRRGHPQRARRDRRRHGRALPRALGRLLAEAAGPARPGRRRASRPMSTGYWPLMTSITSTSTWPWHSAASFSWIASAVSCCSARHLAGLGLERRDRLHLLGVVHDASSRRRSLPSARTPARRRSRRAAATTRNRFISLSPQLTPDQLRAATQWHESAESTRSRSRAAQSTASIRPSASATKARSRSFWTLVAWRKSGSPLTPESSAMTKRSSLRGVGGQA